MKTSLSQSQIQKQGLLPQTKIYLKILQLPLADLRQNLEDALSENPVLDEVEPVEEALSSPDDISEPDKIDVWETQSDEIPSEWDDESDAVGDSHELSRKKAYLDSLMTQPSTLADHLLKQIGLFKLSEDERKVAERMVGDLDDNGYLTLSLQELGQELGRSIDLLEKILVKLQRCEPKGIFARNLEECLLLQLSDSEDEAAPIARKIIHGYFPLLQKKDIPQLSKNLKVSQEKIRSAVKLIQSLDPKPGKSLAHPQALAVIPDCIIRVDADNPKYYQVEIRGSGLPHLRLNPKYRKMQKNKTLDSQARKFIREKVNEAQWLLEAIENRKATLASIVNEVLIKQPDFLERGFGALKPLTMKEIANKLGIHESTVSRAVSGKYIQTPLGTYALRSFFSGKVSSESESEESQRSVMQRIKSLIENENPAKPLSDQKIVKILSEEGIQIARRTVAKYREVLKILPTSLRKKR